MNLRILKKLSKRAAPHLASIGCTWEQFEAKDKDCYTSTREHDRKHWGRYRARYPLTPSGSDIHATPRRGDGTIVVSERSICPWPGTVMLGYVFGHFDLEWEEDDAWSLLKSAVCGHCGEYVEIPGTDDGFGGLNGTWVPTRRLRNPSDILRALPEVIESRRKDVAASEVKP